MKIYYELQTTADYGQSWLPKTWRWWWWWSRLQSVLIIFLILRNFIFIKKTWLTNIDSVNYKSKLFFPGTKITGWDLYNYKKIHRSVFKKKLIRSNCRYRNLYFLRIQWKYVAFNLGHKISSKLCFPFVKKVKYLQPEMKSIESPWKIRKI